MDNLSYSFEKVSFERFAADFYAKLGELMVANADNAAEYIRKDYDFIQLPEAATPHSAGSDFYMPFGLYLPPGLSVTIPTGIRAHIPDNTVLLCFPRSGLGTKHGLALRNTCGVIDSDYYYSDNEGHIMFCIENTGSEGINLNAGDRFVQGVCVPFVRIGKEKNAARNGGFGSTDRKED